MLQNREGTGRHGLWSQAHALGCGQGRSLQIFLGKTCLVRWFACLLRALFGLCSLLSSGWGEELSRGNIDTSPSTTATGSSI